MITKDTNKEYFFNAGTLLILLAALCKLGIHLYSNTNYGFHRDELLHIATSQHLAWGYMEFAP